MFGRWNDLGIIMTETIREDYLGRKFGKNSKLADFRVEDSKSVNFRIFKKRIPTKTRSRNFQTNLVWEV